MADIYLETLSYRKTEADTINSGQDTATTEGLALKLNADLVGSPSGVASLDAGGKHPAVEIPFANNTEAYEGTRTDVVINPATLKYAVDVGTIPADALGTANGVCPLGTDVKVNPIYLPVSPQVDTFVVETLAERDALTDVTSGDRCIVTNDPSDTNGDVNGEWVANVDYPQSDDWSHLPNLSSVQSVNGQTGIVEIITTTQGDDNATNITTWALVSDGNTNDIAALDVRVADNEADILTLQGTTGTNTSDIATNNGLIAANTADVVALDTRVQTLETDVPFSPSYHFDKVTNNTITNDVYQQTGLLTATGLELGTYEFTFSIQWTLDSATTSAFFRYSVDGGNTWVESQIEPQDQSDKNLTMYGFPAEGISGDRTIETQMRKENAADELIVLFNNIILERKL